MTDTNDTDNDLAGLRKAAKDGKAALEENTRLQRELLFARAGVDTTTKTGALLFKAWDGDDIEALKADAEEMGLLKTSTTGNTPPAPKSTQTGTPGDDGGDDDGLDGMDQFRNTLTGRPAGGEQGQGPHPIDVALTTFHADMKKGARREDAALAAIDRILTSRDPRVIFNEAEFRQQAQLGSRLDA